MSYKIHFKGNNNKAIRVWMDKHENLEQKRKNEKRTKERKRERKTDEKNRLSQSPWRSLPLRPADRLPSLQLDARFCKKYKFELLD
jgi:hypothetical protein